MFLSEALFRFFMRKWLCYTVLFFAFGLPAEAQQMNDFGFKREQSIQVVDLNNKELSLAWVGGLNACQFHQIDLNLDGVEDLLLFDRHGNRLLPFINNGSAGIDSYTYSPEFRTRFPAISNWIQLIDYNNDGKKDIFTYTTGGIKVYKNVTEDVLSFLQVTKPFILSLFGSIQTNILVTSVDYPAILDLDGDGDLDILTFWGLGSFVEMHTNQSVELFGNSDSLRFIKTNYCWGRFAENQESNAITLDTCLIFSENDNVAHGKERHTGSTLMATDLTGDGIVDLVLGDIDYASLLLLKNEGTNVLARMVSVDTLFPVATKPVRLFSFPAAGHLDLDRDGKKDLIASPFTPSLIRSNHQRSNWFYKNIGSNTNPVFEFVTDKLFQDRMIDLGGGATPVFFDINKDGLSDLFAGNYGYMDTCVYVNYTLTCKYKSRMAYFKNTGSASAPKFKLISDDFAGLSSLGLLALHPTFGDLTGDGNADMLVGNANGNLLFFENISGGSEEINFVIRDNHFFKISVGAYSTPQLFDLNSDGLLDLLVGQMNGKISFYMNQGSLSQPNFIKITDNLGNINVTNPNLSYNGFSVPCIFRLNDGSLRLFVGSESGRTFYYKNISNNLNGSFTLVDESIPGTEEGIRTAPAVAYLTSTTYPDLVLGNYAGGLNYFKGVAPQPYGIKDRRGEYQGILHIYPNPANEYFILKIENALAYTQAVLKIFDATGRLILSESHFSTEPAIIDARHWKKGIFMVIVTLTEKGGKSFCLHQKVVVSN